MTPTRKTLLFTAASLTLAATACSGAADDASAVNGAPASQPAASADGTAGSAGQAGSYADGEYSAQGSYIPPSNQTEEVDVTLTLEGGIVTSLEVSTSGNNPTSKQYQREFTSGIAEQVVGKALDGLNVDKVAGSSLTSSGFDKALETIRTEAGN